MNDLASNSREDDGALQPCPMCQEPISPAAKLCRHCKSDFTWKRFLPLGSTTMAMATALIAVVAAVGPQIIRMFEVPNSHLSGSLIFNGRSGSSKATALITNSGSRLGAVTGGRLSMPLKKASGSGWIGVQLHVSGDDEDHIVFVPPNSTMKVDFRLGRVGLVDGLVDSTGILVLRDHPAHSEATQEEIAAVENAPKGTRCRLRLFVANADSTFESEVSTFECSAGHPFQQMMLNLAKFPR
ncbi:hypothetical protein [Variovorax sp. J31P207]|uniref:hypothetical protein n=1 Tax=Variovorax sp. J31P207 TaxID=3053510 RepID=UPI0025791369|nr:hypothetical protein [Variovorax sp. J31P207]MDM0071631.1 hypothetical protein [Variovorax sp. J31P207]